MKQHEQVIKVMELNGGFATLGFLYQNVNVSRWKTKTPFASIRRIVQDERYFLKIKPGLWALNSKREIITKLFDIEKNKKNIDFTHYFYQGLILEIGNIKGFNTYIPPQDKNKLYLNKPLQEIATLTKIYNFTYSDILDRAKTIDVIWFNNRKLPSYFFEVEHSTNIQNSLLKFYELQDFYSKFYIVSSVYRKKEYEKKISLSAFKEIKERVNFVDYDFIANLHSKSFELYTLGDL
ncbi:MAG: hypothetical protein K8R37_11995 [Bacteroidales bacterium]|nr:hypothetical protein [Bacteroidales bacterium]